MASHDPSDRQRPRRPSRLQNYAVGMVIGSLMAIVGTIAIVVLLRASELPPVTFEKLDAAAARWKAHGPADYDLEIEQTGVNPASYHIEVRHENVVAMTMNNRPTPPHTWDDWSVPGLLGIIRRDLEVCMAPRHGSPSLRGEGRGEGEVEKADGGLQPDPVVPRGRFDAELGYPVQYHRVTQTGADAKWKITKFTLK